MAEILSLPPAKVSSQRPRDKRSSPHQELLFPDFPAQEFFGSDHAEAVESSLVQENESFATPVAEMAAPSAAGPVDLADAAARAQALDTSRSWIVEAPAGSGKTSLLVQRFLCLLRDPKVTEPEQVLAITFTRAAAEEIRERVLRELRNAAEHRLASTAYDLATRAMAEAVLRRDAASGWGLLEEPRRLRVQTIDGLCGEIARSLPVLSGGAGALRPVESPGPLYAEAAKRTMLKLGGDDAGLNEALRVVLLHRDGDLRACMAMLAEMLELREQWGELVPLKEAELTAEALDGVVRPRLDEALETAVCRGLAELESAFPAGLFNRLARFAAALAKLPARSEPHPFAHCAGLEEAPEAAGRYLEQWRSLIDLLVTKTGPKWRAGFRSNHLGLAPLGKKPDPEQAGLLRDLADTVEELRHRDDLIDQIKKSLKLPPPKYPDDQWQVAKALFLMLRQGLIELQMVFAERGECDFPELALEARAALEGGAEGVESALGVRLQHLLVDEVQDTSTRQYQLLELLTRGWAGEGRTVFLVGDPKQSIYLFRQARVERFMEVMSTGKMGELDVQPLHLTANFRSQAGLVRAFNQDFAAVFSGSQESGVKYAEATPVAGEVDGVAGAAGAAWHIGIAQGDAAEVAESSRSLSLQAAREVRRIVASWQARPLPPGRSTPWKIAVLVRARNGLQRILPELQRTDAGHAVPYRAVAIDPLAERREILDLLALTRALLHPVDRVAWWAVLRAPWCGLPLADLHLLAGQDDEGYARHTVMELVRARGHELSADSIARLERVWPVLEAAVRQRESVRTPELVERTWQSLGGASWLGRSECENAETFLRLLRTIDGERGEVTLGEVSRRMERLYAAAKQDDAAVELMTIHGAKGLEWDAVIVPELGQGTQNTRSRLLDWEEVAGTAPGEVGVVLAPIEGKGEASRALGQWVRSLRARRDAAERKRLLYVAATRARMELHLFGVAAEKRDGTVKPRPGSLLEAGWAAAESRMGAQGGSEAAAVSYANVLQFRGGRDEDAPEGEGLELAAAGVDGEVSAPHEPDLANRPETESGERPAIVDRLPLSYQRFPAESSAGQESREQPIGAARSFLRPTGSYTARTFGNAMHAFLEQASRALEGGVSPDALLQETDRWEPRIAAVLRNEGLAPRIVAAHARDVLNGVQRTLGDATGRWLLGARHGGRSELPLTVASDELRHYRIDRIFRAGTAPGDSDGDCLWIVDYKTSTHGGREAEAFLKEEREKYRAQLEAYARALGEPEVRVGLWFPVLARFEWWIVPGV